MTEDGGETDNIFQANLGATTKPVARLINRDDTDAAFPTTFWCSNPMNEWVGNVAAGSQAFGYWFELAETVRPPTLFFPSSKGMNPRTLPLQKFVNNVAHSNNKSALRKWRT
jgi:cell surface hyaluronidase